MSRVPGAATCPHCGSALWILHLHAEYVPVTHTTVRSPDPDAGALHKEPAWEDSEHAEWERPDFVACRSRDHLPAACGRVYSLPDREAPVWELTEVGTLGPGMWRSILAALD